MLSTKNVLAVVVLCLILTIMMQNRKKETQMQFLESRPSLVRLRVVVGVDERGVIGRTYNGKFMGPTIRVRRGETLRILLQNELEADAAEKQEINALHAPNTTSLHVHGLHVSPREDDVFTPVRPGESKLYEYHIPQDHPQGTFWYHPHFVGSSSIQVVGMAGAFVVDDHKEEDKVILLQQTNLAVGGARNYAIGSLRAGSRLAVSTADADPILQTRSFFTVNGHLEPTLSLTEKTRWRVINAASDDIVNMSFAALPCQLLLLAQDGIERKVPLEIEYILLSPGSRADLTLAESCQRGHYPITAAPLDTILFGNGTDVYTHGILFFVNLTSPSHHNRMNHLFPDSLLIQENSTDKELIIPFVFKWSQHLQSYGVNGKSYNPHRLDRVLHLNQIEEWILVAPPEVKTAHPFHLHTNHFQIVRVEPPLPSHLQHLLEPGSWRDTILIPVASNVTIRFLPRDFTGPSLAHCHVFVHEDLGMDFSFNIVMKEND